MTRIGRGILKISQGLVLAIPVCLVSIGAEQDVRHPVRRSAHLLTDHIQVNIRVALDYQLIMNMTDDEAVPESLHGIAEDVAADSLDDVLHELRTVGLNAFPLFCGANSFIGLDSPPYWFSPMRGFT